MSEIWSPQQANDWYARVSPIVGCNYLPRTAVNSTEMWQAQSFDPETIDEELGWAAAAGYNSLRIFVQYLVWLHDPDGLLQRMDRLLSIAAGHGISTTFILFDDCAFAGREPYLGVQDDPKPGVHNSGWTPSPGLKLVEDRSVWPQLEAYAAPSSAPLARTSACSAGTFTTSRATATWASAAPRWWRRPSPGRAWRIHSNR